MSGIVNNPALIGDTRVGTGERLLVIAGPCVIETAELTMEIAKRLQGICAELPVQLIFKASFDKANRSSGAAYRGPGFDAGLEILADVKRATGLPVTTDIHQPRQAPDVGKVCDLIQIPAFLARQTDLLNAAAATGRAVHVKKPQIAEPWSMYHVVNKLSAAGCRNVILCERGTFFGYGYLVNDMRAIPRLKAVGCPDGVPVTFDATHSAQEPTNALAGGCRAMSEVLARAAIAAGADGLFVETHPTPDKAPCDGEYMIPLDDFGQMLRRLVKLREVVIGL